MSLPVLLLALAAQEPPPAESLLVAGQFAQSRQAFEARWSRDTTDYRAALQAGRLSLYANQLDAAEAWLRRAIALRPGEAGPKSLLAEARYRRDDFAGAAALLREANRIPRATTLESFQGVTPNAITGPDVSRLPFVITDPLPIVRAFVNGSDTLFLLIDTGGAELLLDSAVARAAGAQRFGEGMGTFAGGQAPIADGRVDSLRLGDFTLRHVPVKAMGLAHIERSLGRRVDGVLGTVVLYHFLATLDYPAGELVLRRRTPAARAAFDREAAARRAAVAPFWLAGDHFMFAWGRVNGRPPVLLFVDTGLAGGGFLTTDSLARALGIDVAAAVAAEGVGGAGPTRVRWGTVDSLQLGGITERNLRTALGAALRFRDSFGFDAAGIISHGFFRPYALTFDFDAMELVLTRP